MLSGTPPFYEEDNFALFEQIKACKYDFEVETWNTVSKEAKDFISKILVADPAKRITVKEMMEHPWMNMDLDNSVKLDEKIKKSLFKYVSVRRDKSQKYKE